MVTMFLDGATWKKQKKQKQNDYMGKFHNKCNNLIYIKWISFILKILLYVVKINKPYSLFILATVHYTQEQML